MNRKCLRAVLAVLACLLPAVSLAESGAFSPEAYEAGREALTGPVQAYEELTEEEKAVDELLSLLKEEAGKYYSSGTGYGLASRNNSLAAASGLMEFCRSIPKGADLHNHDYTTVPMDRLLDVLTAYPGVCIDLEQGASFASLYAPGSEMPDTAIPLDQALERGLVTREEIHASTSLPAGRTPRQAWDAFEPFFSRISHLSVDPELHRQVFEAAFRSCVDNRVLLVELRVIFSESDESNHSLLSSIRDAYYAVRADVPAFTVRVIACSSKHKSVTDTDERFRSAIRMSREFLDESDPADPRPLIIGLDLVGEEDTCEPLSDYTAFFLSDEFRESGLHLYLHCGESLEFTNESVVDAWLCGTRRFGHAFNLFRFPKVVRAALENRIAVEVCPVSNCLLGYARDLRLHPAQDYLRLGIPIVLCSDDALFMEDYPLSEDYFAAVLSWDLSLQEIRQIARNSILYCDLSEAEQDGLMSAWEDQWQDFIREWSRRESLEQAA